MEQKIFTSICDTVKQAFQTESFKNPNLISPITLAYIGDTVYDLFVRLYMISTTDYTANMLHKLSTGVVCAKSQAAAFHAIEASLSEEELYIFQRGRNANSTPPKNCDKTVYRTATGLEALIGYLFLSGKDERLCEIMQMILKLSKQTVRKDTSPCQIPN